MTQNDPHIPEARPEIKLKNLVACCPECGYDYCATTGVRSEDNGDIVILFACELGHPFRLRIHHSKGQELLAFEKASWDTTSLWSLESWPKCTTK